jgi:hypothetical protein
MIPHRTAEAWGGNNPFGVPFFIVTHRPDDAPAGAGKRLFDEFDQPLTLEHVNLLQSPFATHITHRVVR